MSTKPKKSAKVPVPNYPPGHPEAVAMMADAMPWKTTARNFPLETYYTAIAKLHARGYSYADIAKFLNEQLAGKLEGKKITRGQVYRVYQQCSGIDDPFRNITSVTHISDEDAEKQAEVEDKKPAETSEGETP